LVGNFIRKGQLVRRDAVYLTKARIKGLTGALVCIREASMLRVSHGIAAVVGEWQMGAVLSLATRRTPTFVAFTIGCHGANLARALRVLHVETVGRHESLRRFVRYLKLATLLIQVEYYTLISW